MTAKAEVLETGKLAAKEGMIATLPRFFKEKPLGATGATIFMLMIVVAILAPWITPESPTATDVAGRLAAPSLAHLLGTDELGRDVLSRLIYGTQMSMLVGVTTTLLGATIGALIGVVSGYLGGRVDMTIQRIMDIIMAFPQLILAISIMAVLGSSVINVIIAIAIPSIPRANRVVRSVAISVKEFQYIEAAKAVGAKSARIIFRHILPNCLASYLIMATAQLGSAIMVEASLSFLGLGVPPPHPSWGRSLSESMTYYYQNPLLAIFPGLAISTALFAANMFGDALRDIWDPRLKRL